MSRELLFVEDLLYPRSARIIAAKDGTLEDYMTKQETPQWLTPEYWQGRFMSRDTPWELGHPSVVLLEAVDELARRGDDIRGKRILSPGCGTGSDAFALAERGARVLAVDWSPSALTAIQMRAQGLSPESGSIQVESGDFFLMTPQPVDVVAEHTFFCAIDPSARGRYVDRIRAWLTTGGYLVGNFFVLSDDDARMLPGLSLTSVGEGPPFATTVAELRRLLSPTFEEILLRPATRIEPDRRPGMEWVGIFRKR